MPTIYAVFFVVMLNMTAYRGSKVVVTLFAIELGAAQLAIGALVAMYALFPMMLGLYAGKLTDRLGVRFPMIAGTVGLSIGLSVPFVFPHAIALYCSAMFIGASWVFYNVCAQNLIGALSDVASRPRNFGNYGLVMAIGSFFGPTLAGLGIDHLGHQNTYLWLAVAPLVAAAIIAALRAIPRVTGKPESEQHAGDSASLLKDAPLRQTLLTSAIVLTGTDLFQFYMPIYGHKIGLSASAIGIILGTFAVASFVVRLVMPTLVKRYSADTVLIFALYVGAVAYVLFPLFESAVLLAAVALILGLGMGCSQPVSLMLIYDRAPAGRSGEALGLRLTINNVMHIAVPMLFGSLGTLFGVTPVFAANAAILAAGGVLSSRARASAVRVQAPKTGIL